MQSVSSCLRVLSAIQAPQTLQNLDIQRMIIPLSVQTGSIFSPSIRNTQTPGTPTLLVLFTAVMVGSPEDGISHGVLPFTPVYVTCGLIRGLIQVNEKSFDLKEGWYKEEGDKTGMNGCMLPW